VHGVHGISGPDSLAAWQQVLLPLSENSTSTNVSWQPLALVPCESSLAYQIATLALDLHLL